MLPVIFKFKCIHFRYDIPVSPRRIAQEKLRARRRQQQQQQQARFPYQQSAHGSRSADTYNKPLNPMFLLRNNNANRQQQQAARRCSQEGAARTPYQSDYKYYSADSEFYKGKMGIFNLS